MPRPRLRSLLTTPLLIATSLLLVPAVAIAQTAPNPAPATGQATPEPPATPPTTGPSSGTAPGNEGSTGWTGGTGGSFTGTSSHAPTPGSPTPHPDTVEGLAPKPSGSPPPSSPAAR